MGRETGIQWAHHTWSPWRGCTKISPGCANCYADATSRRNPAVLGEWGPQGTRVVNANWDAPRQWDRAAAKSGERRRVFPSLCDPFEQWDKCMLDTNEHPLLVDAHGNWKVDGIGVRLLTMGDVRVRWRWLMYDTPHLDWLVLTKRPKHAQRWLEDHLAPNNVWLGVSVEDQPRADDRIPILLVCPARLRWLSVEPLLGPVNLTKWLDRLDWVVVGGESGPNARPCDIAWIAAIVNQYQDAGVPCFVKQLGAVSGGGGEIRGLRHPKGGDPSEWPERFRIQEYPTPKGATP